MDDRTRPTRAATDSDRLPLEQRRRRHRTLFAQIPTRLWSANSHDGVKAPEIGGALDRWNAEVALRDAIDELLQHPELAVIEHIATYRRTVDLVDLARRTGYENAGPTEAVFEAAADHLLSLQSEAPPVLALGAEQVTRIRTLAGLMMLADMLADDGEPRPRQ